MSDKNVFGYGDNDIKSNQKIKKVQARMFLIRLCLFFVMSALAAGIGSGSYFILSTFEENVLHEELEGVGIQFKRNFDIGIMKQLNAAEMGNSYYQAWVKNANLDTFPNVTIPDFDGVMTKVAALADLKLIALAPLVTTKDRKSFEAYARSNVNLLNGPTELQKRPSGCNSSSCHWLVADGMYSYENGVKKSVHDSIEDTEYPDIHFPVWQMAPLEPNYQAIMLDFHATPGTQKSTVDKVLKTKTGQFTDILQLIQDAKPRPSAIYVSPIFSDKKGETITGLLFSVFSFDDLLRNAIYKKDKGVQCVITSPSNIQYTLQFDSGDVTVVGKGDLHNKKYDKYRQSINTNAPSIFQIDIYPTESFVAAHLSNIPTTACLVVVFSVAFTGSLFLIYLLIERRFQSQLLQLSQTNFAAVLARDIMLNEKKVYVRYISHEVSHYNDFYYIFLFLL